VVVNNCNHAEKIIADFICGLGKVEMCGGDKDSPFRFFKCTCGEEVFLVTKLMARGLRPRLGLPMQFIKKVFWGIEKKKVPGSNVTAFSVELAKNPFGKELD